jgi:hypothetical protein
MKMKKINKKYSLLIISIFLFISISLAWGICTGSPGYQVETFTVTGGYGYQIKQEGKVIIRQPVIPAIQEKKPFATQNQALTVGNIVKERVEQKKDFSVTVQELRKLNIK